MIYNVTSHNKRVVTNKANLTEVLQLHAQQHDTFMAETIV